MIWSKSTRGSMPIVFALIMLYGIFFVLLIPKKALACGNGVLQAYVPHLPSQDGMFYLCISSGWNAVGLKPQINQNYDLILSDFYAVSELPQNEIDIVLIDANHAGELRYHLEVIGDNHPNGYLVEWAPSLEVISEGTYGPFAFDENSILHTWDLLLTNTSLYYVTVQADSMESRIGFAVFDSDDSNSSTFYQSRIENIASKTLEGQGVESISVLPNILDEYGLVIWNNISLGAEYMIYIDASPPQGDITINNGAPYAIDPSVELSLNILDEETGIKEICLSNDTKIWSCQIPVNDTSLQWQLANVQGNNTVFAQITNHAGMAIIISDTIFLDHISPSITINNPIPGRPIVNQSSILFSGHVFDQLPSSGIKGLEIQLEAVGKNGQIRVEAQPAIDDDLWSYFWDTSLYNLSNITATIRAVDNAGNQSSAISLSWRYVTTGTTFLPIVVYQPYLLPGCILGSNNNIETASGPLQLNIEYCGYLDDRSDFYKFSIDEIANIKIHLHNKGYQFPHQPTWPPNNQMFLYDSEKNFIASCCRSAKFMYSIEELLEPGDYFLLVYARDIVPTISYTIRIED